MQTVLAGLALTIGELRAQLDQRDQELDQLRARIAALAPDDPAPPADT